MSSTRRALASVVILLAVAVVVFIAASGGLGRGSNVGAVSSRSPAGSTIPSEAPTPSVVAQVPEGFDGPEFDPELIREPTAHKPQSKLWYHDGRWWGILLNPAGELTIHWLAWGTQAWSDTGVLVDPRGGMYSDVAVADDGALYVITAGGARTSGGVATDLPDSANALFRRYSYDPDAARYQLDSGFPVAVTSGGASTATIDLDADGRPWMSYVSGGQVWISSTDGDDRRWYAPFPLPSQGNSAGVTQAAIIARDAEIGVLWSNEAEDAVYFASHVTGADIDAWSTSRIVVEGYENADDHLNVKALDGPGGGIYAVVKTSLNDVRPRLPDRELIVLLARDESGEWTKVVVGRVRDDHSRPILLVDESSRELYVFATAPGRFGDVYYKRSSLDDLRFATGRGELFMSAVDHAISSPTTTKQPVGAETGIVVLATDTATHRYIHGAMSLGSVQPGMAEELPGAGREPSGPEAGTVLFHDTFDAYQPGESPLLPWKLTTEPQGLLTLVPGLEGVGVRLHSATGEAVRACHDASTGTSPIFSVTARLAVERLGTNDGYLLSVRGPDSELASVRVVRDGELAVVNGEEKVRTGLVLAAGAWYDVTVRIDLTARTYAWGVRDATTGAELAAGTANVPASAEEAPDRVCFLSPTGSDPRGIVIDDVVAARSDG